MLKAHSSSIVLAILRYTYILVFETSHKLEKLIMMGKKVC